MATFYTQMFADIDTAVAGFVMAKAAAVMESISAVSTSMYVLYLAFYVLAMSMGKVREPIYDLSLRILLMSFILGIGLNMDLFMTYLGNFLSKAPDEMAAVLSGSDAQGSIGETLDSIMTDAFASGDKAFEKMGLMKGFGASLILFAVGLVLYVVGVAATVYAAFLIILAKIAMAVILSLGPIAVILLMFKSTQKFFESWLGQMLNYGLMIVLTVAVVSLLFDPLKNYVEDIANGADVKTGDAAILLAMGIITVLVLRQVPSMASGLAGGMTISTLGFVERASGGLYRQTMQRRPYSTRDANGNQSTVYRRPVMHRAGQAVGGTFNVARNLYRRGTGQDVNSVSRG